MLTFEHFRWNNTPLYLSLSLSLIHLFFHVISRTHSKPEAYRISLISIEGNDEGRCNASSCAQRSNIKLHINTAHVLLLLDNKRNSALVVVAIRCNMIMIMEIRDEEWHTREHSTIKLAACAVHGGTYAKITSCRQLMFGCTIEN